MNKTFHLIGSSVFLMPLIGVLYAGISEAASISITSPVTAVNVADGEDFFSDVLNNPIDFDKRRDVLWEEHFSESTISVSNNIWSGDFGGHVHGGYIFPHFQGVPGALNSGLTGTNYPLDSTKYRYVSLMDKVSERSVRRLYWTRDGNWPDNTLKTTGQDGTFLTGSVAEEDGYRTTAPNNQQIIHSADTWVIYLVDLTSKEDWTSAPVTGIRFDASPQAGAGTNVKFKWFRSIDPATSPSLDLTWNTSGLAVPSPKVNIYVDTDNSGFDGAFLTRVDASQRVFTFPTAALPAGTYYFYLKLYDNIGTDGLLATSGYSAALTINGKSSISFLSPSMTSGSDYATDIVGNSWDMDSALDVANLNNPDYQKAFVSEQFVGGAFEAKAVIVGGAQHTDAQVWMNISDSQPIDTSKYRYLTYTLSADGTYYGNISDKVQRGWVARLIWWTDGLAIDGEQTNDNVLYEGTHSYTVDLHSNNIIEPNSALSGMKWTDNPTVASFRVDPLETYNAEGTVFSLHDVLLTAIPESAADNTFTSSFVISDPENDQVNVEFYLDTDNIGYNGTSLGNADYSTGNQQVILNMCNLSPGQYFLHAKLTDGFGNISYRYADAPINLVQNTDCAVTPAAVLIPIYILLMDD